VLYSEPLSKHTTFKIGGPVDVWAEPRDLDDMQALLEISKAEGLQVFLIGEGSNLLVSDKGLNAAAIHLGDLFQAGGSLQRFILNTIDAGYGGLEFMAGIPGTVGGAIRMNAGAGLKGPWISDFIEKIKVCDFSGGVRHIEKKELGFGYRQSGLKNYIVLEAEFNLEKTKDKRAVREEYKKFLAKKKEKQELSIASAGCVFKNPGDPQLSAAQLIEGCGLKGKAIGGAMISFKHANFIVNTGKATFENVVGLVEVIKDEVFKKYNITLETEIEILK